jgi:hypothetical protein
MFSYKIHNPNNFEITGKDYYIIPFGHRCTSALSCGLANLRKMSLPFDWVVAFPDQIQKVLENDFKDFIPNVESGELINKYGICFGHFNQDVKIGIEEYKRRIRRFKNIIHSSKKIYFVHINEDYLYRPTYRNEIFNNKNFENLLKMEEFLKKTFININYNILYFNFIQHDILKYSNIINIVLFSKFLFENKKECVEIGLFHKKLRFYCAIILAKMFNTSISSGYDDGIFIN